MGMMATNNDSPTGSFNKERGSPSLLPGGQINQHSRSAPPPSHETNRASSSINIPGPSDFTPRGYNNNSLDSLGMTNWNSCNELLQLQQQQQQQQMMMMQAGGGADLLFRGNSASNADDLLLQQLKLQQQLLGQSQQMNLVHSLPGLQTAGGNQAFNLNGSIPLAMNQGGLNSLYQDPLQQQYQLLQLLSSNPAASQLLVGQNLQSLNLPTQGLQAGVSAFPFLSSNDQVTARNPPEGGKKKRKFHSKPSGDDARNPLSAYNFFFSEEREIILALLPDKVEEGQKNIEDMEVDELNDFLSKQSLPEEEMEALQKKIRENTQKILDTHYEKDKPKKSHKKMHGKINFQKLASLIGTRWRSKSNDEKARYFELSKKDKERFENCLKDSLGSNMNAL
ncbi:hypothetical protein CTEN210_11320 [Chaetoceros tenuissimus]|uniref:HMG box domain-containing protein n=1 Tax=Chaetoceros tenuissimus TaxID=426638 RepID=A0AAD3H9F7_9STRA|nr:hypothetical protein CTEN210_11320 [Chaetoceros tenuissimus]